MQTILLCVNARLLETTLRRQIDAVRSSLIDRGCRVEMVSTVPLHQGPSIRRDYLLSLAPDAVLVCGGDGTVFDALQTVGGTGVALGIVPFGTANILAQNLRLRGSPAAIATALLDSTPRPVRLGRVLLSAPHAAEYRFLCAAGAGPHAAVMQLATSGIKRLAGKAAYWAAGIQAWLRQPPRPFLAETTDAHGRTNIWRVSEAVALRVPALNIWRPGGSLDGNLLRLAMVPATTRLGFAGAVTRAVLSRKLAELTSELELVALLRNSGDAQARLPRAVTAFYQDAVRVICRPLQPESAARPWVQADGELLDSATTTFEMADESVQLLAPALPFLS